MGPATRSRKNITSGQRGWLDVGMGPWGGGKVNYWGFRNARTGKPYNATMSNRKYIAGKSRTSGYYGRYNKACGELKFHDIDVNDTLISAAGTILNNGSINLIPQGTTEVTRIGRKAVLRSIGWHWWMGMAADATVGVSDTVRVIMYQDKQCNGVTIGATTLMENDSFQSFRNLANNSRFIVHYDKTFDVPIMAAAGNGTNQEQPGSVLSGSFYKDVNIPIEFNGVAGALTEIRSNNLGVLLFSRVGAKVGFVSKVRLRFSDS